MRNFIVLFLLVFISIDCDAQWVKIKENSSITKIYANDNYVFISVSRPNDQSQYGMYDIFISEDNGDSFIATKSPDFTQYDIFFVGDEEYAKASVSGYYKYMKSGMNWEPLDNVSYMTPKGKSLNIPDEITDNEYPEIMEFNNIISVATFNNGVFYSNDNGKTFRNSNLSEPVHKFFTNGNSLYAYSSSGLYISTNYGKTWNKKSLNMNCIEPCNIGNIISYSGNIVVSIGSKVYLSKDDCKNWIDLSEGLIDSSEGNIWGSFAVNNKYIFYSYDGGVFRRNIK